MSEFPGVRRGHTVRVYYRDGRTEDIPVLESFVVAKADGIIVSGRRADGAAWRPVDSAQVDRVHEVEPDVWYTRPE